jgi:hypothetical protein
MFLPSAKAEQLEVVVMINMRSVFFVETASVLVLKLSGPSNSNSTRSICPSAATFSRIFVSRSPLI